MEIKKDENMKRRIVQLNFRPVYTLKDKRYNLMQAEKSVLVHAFGKQYQDAGYGLNDVLEMYKKRHNAIEAKKVYLIRNLKDAIRSWNEELAQTDRELCDKKCFRKALIRHARESEGQVLFDLKLSDKGITCDIDAVLIMKKGVVPLTLRTRNSDAGIDEDGNYCRFDTESVSLKKENIRREQVTQRLLFEGMLDGIIDPSIKVYPALIIGGNKESSFSCLNRKDICYGRLDDMEKRIYLGDVDVFDRETMDAIVKRIKSTQVKTHREKIPFRSQLLEDYCYLIANW